VQAGEGGGLRLGGHGDVAVVYGNAIRDDAAWPRLLGAAFPALVGLGLATWRRVCVEQN
jgi:hypothetical protein